MHLLKSNEQRDEREMATLFIFIAIIQNIEFISLSILPIAIKQYLNNNNIKIPIYTVYTLNIYVYSTLLIRI